MMRTMGMVAAMLLAGGLAGAKGTTPEDTTGQKERQMASCPSAVPGARTTVENRKAGVAVIVTADDPQKRDEIRRRAHIQENVAMQAAARGAMERTGTSTGSGKLGLCPGMIEGGHVTVAEVPGGSRLTVRAASHSQARSLQKMTRQRLRQIEARR